MEYGAIYWSGLDWDGKRFETLATSSSVFHLLSLRDISDI